MPTNLGNLLTKLTLKFGNQSTKYFTQEDRVSALNYARNILGLYDFPELIRTSDLAFASTTLNGNDVARATEPTDLARVAKLWDTTSKAEFSYVTNDYFDQMQTSNTFTREYQSGVRYFFVVPDTTTSLKLRYIKQIEQFSASDPTAENEFDPRYDDTIIDGAIGWLSAKRRNFSDFQAFDEMYREKVMRMYQDLAYQGGWQEHPRLTLYAEKFNTLQTLTSPRPF